jgi:hypothetical protein
MGEGSVRRNVHLKDQAVADRVDMTNQSVVEERAVSVAKDLMNVNDDASRRVHGKALRFDVAVNLEELARPVGPNLVVAHCPRSVDHVRPVDIFMKSRQCRVDIPGVECRVGTSQRCFDIGWC